MSAVKDARRHLKANGWSYRTAAPVLGVHYVHLALVLTGKRESAALVRRVMELGDAGVAMALVNEPVWLIIGVSAERVGVPFIYRQNGRFASFHGTPEDLAAARTWKTREGAERFIEREKAAGSNWTYALWPVSAV